MADMDVIHGILTPGGTRGRDGLLKVELMRHDTCVVQESSAIEKAHNFGKQHASSKLLMEGPCTDFQRDQAARARLWMRQHRAILRTAVSSQNLLPTIWFGNAMPYDQQEKVAPLIAKALP